MICPNICRMTYFIILYFLIVSWFFTKMLYISPEDRLFDRITIFPRSCQDSEHFKLEKNENITFCAMSSVFSCESLNSKWVYDFDQSKDAYAFIDKFNKSADLNSGSGKNFGRDLHFRFNKTLRDDFIFSDRKEGNSYGKHTVS